MASLNIISGIFYRRRWLLALMITIFFWISACAQGDLPTRVPITATAARPLTLIGLSDNATVLHPYLDGSAIDSHYRIIEGNDQILIRDVLEGRLDAAIVYWIPENETLWFNPIALDGIVIIHSPDNPLENLDLAEVQSIFRGRVRNWSELGGHDGDISLISREMGSGSRVTFERQIMTGFPIFPYARVVSSDEKLVDLVKEDANAVSYMMMGSSEGSEAFSISSIDASPDTTANQTYPLTAPLYFVSLQEPEGNLRTLLATIQSQEGQISLSEIYGRIR